MSKHVEMIIDYITEGTDYQYCDNKGILTRCKDCIFANPYVRVCNRSGGLDCIIGELDYCSRAVRKDAGNS